MGDFHSYRDPFADPNRPGCTSLCECLQIDKVQTAPYRSQTNGMVERLHRILGAMLRKACASKLDWAAQVPFAMFVLRAAPNRDTGLSLYELVYGKLVRTPMDVLHSGWLCPESQQLDVKTWGELLVSQLEALRDVAKERRLVVTKKRKQLYDKGTSSRSFEIGDSVCVRTPCMDGKLEAAWSQVVERIGDVDYRLDLDQGRKKVWHVNNLKKVYEREAAVLWITVLAEYVSEEECRMDTFSETCEG